MRECRGRAGLPPQAFGGIGSSRGIYTYIHTCVCVYGEKNYKDTHTWVYVCLYIHKHTSIYVRIHIHSHLCVHICTHTQVCACICVYICVYWLTRVHCQAMAKQTTETGDAAAPPPPPPPPDHSSSSANSLIPDPVAAALAALTSQVSHMCESE